MTNYEEYLSDKTAIPEEPPEFKTITLKCYVECNVDIPETITDEDEIKEYLKWAYDDSELLRDHENLIIEEIE